MSTENQNQLAVSQPVKASDQLATFLGIEKGMMLETLKAQCFKGSRPDQITDAQLAAFVSTANALKVNPLLPGFLYAYPERNGGITPILGPDGVLKKLDEHISEGKLDGYECVVFPEDVTQKPTHATATIYRAGKRPAIYTAIFAEWAVSGSPVWGNKPRHMLWIRAIKQAARQVIHGLPMDAEEYQMSQMTNVTPEEAAPAPARPAPPERKKKGAASVVENVQEAEVVKAVEPAAEPVKVVEAAPEPVKVDSVNRFAGGVVGAPHPAEAKPAPADETQVGSQKEIKAAVESFKDAAEATVVAAQIQPRAFLKDGESLECEISVSEVAPLNITTSEGVKPSVKAKVKGGYVGEIYHVGGGTAGGDGKAQVKAPWSVGASLKVLLTGKLNNKAKNENGTLGRVQVFVSRVEMADDEAMEA